MQERRLLTLLISLLLLLSITTLVSAEENDYYFVASTTSDANGHFTFEDIPNGEYTLYSVNNSYSSKYAEWRWYNGKVDLTVNSSDITDLNVSVASGSDIDENEVLAYLYRSSISGTTYLYAMSKYYYKASTLVLVDKQTDELVANTTSDPDGHFTFENVPNGEYTLYSVNNSYSSKYAEWRWYNGKVDLTVNSSDITDLNVSVVSGSDIDENDVLAYLDHSEISGTTYLYAMSKYYYKASTLVLVDKQTDELVANTTSDPDGHFTFENVPNGEYTLYSVNNSYSSKYVEWRWYNGKVDLTVNSSNITDLNVSVASGSDIDEKEVLAYLDRSSISGTTYLYAMSKYYYKASTLVLLKKKPVSEINNAPHLNVSIVTGYSSYEEELANFTKRINSNADLNITASSYITTKLPDNIDLSDMDIIYIVMVTQSAPEFEETVQAAIDNGALVIGSNTYLPESNYTAPSGYNETSFKALLSEYWSGGSFDDSNFDNLIFFLAREYYNRADLTVEAPEGLSRAIYHPAMTDMPVEYFTGSAEDYFTWYANRTDGHAFNENAPTIGITFYSSYFPDDMDPIDKLIEGFEAKGANVIPCYGKSGYSVDSYLNYSASTKVDAVVSFNYRGNYFDLEELGVPVLNAVLNGYMNTSEWENTSTPLPTTNMLRIYGPETDGLIDPIMIGALEKFEVDNSTVEKYIGKDEQVQWLVNRTLAQANLSLEREYQKKVAILYYNHGGGKNNIGASYLEVAPSIVNLLNGMADEGYDVNRSLIPNKTALVDLILYQGRNIGTWAPGELEALVDTGEAVLIPESTYLSWFNELPEERREEVIETWGEPPGDIMVYTADNGSKFIVLPKISLSDNVILAPQPTRGWLQDNEVLYHDTELAPHHQYIAFYMWLQHEFGANVMVNMGRHGTVEWLPGKDFCLFSDEWPSIMVGDIPVIYPYVMDGMGEGMQAKRRGNAVIIDHLIPPVVSAGLYGNYSLLSTDITSYQTLPAEDSKAYLQEILNLTIELGLDEQVNMSLAENNETIDDFLEELDDVLTELKSQSMPYGLHVLGEAPTGEELVGMVNSMLGDDFSEMVAEYNDSDSAPTDLLSLVLLENVSTTEAQMQVLGNSNASIEEELNTSIKYAQLLGESDEEVEQVLNAMDGKYISPNLGGDPILRSETLPSGRNFYAFDEQLIPTKEAWEEGKALVDEWLEEYANSTENEEKYPKKVGYILWAGESTRHKGIMESELLYMMGIKPVWNADNNEVEDVEVINSSELGRPRIDVIVQISGLYRDTFPMKVELLDKAVRLAYEQEATDEYDNYVAQNTDALQATLNETIKNGSLSLDIAQFRVFGPADGAYGTGMANAVASSDTWDNTSELAELYISKMCYVYGQNIWGQTISEYIKQQTGQVIDINNSIVFEENLNGTEAIFHSRSSSTYGSLDTNDFYQYLGGLYNAIKYISGTAPEAYVVNLQDLNDMEIQTLQTYLTNELYARYLNPTWISGMQLNGYEGAEVMDKFVENLWGWEALCPDLISDDIWEKVYGTYVTDSELSDWLKETNPYAYQSMLASMINTIYEGSWDASDEVLQNLVAEYVKSVAENDVTCCHHTCGNSLLEDYIEGIMSIPGVVDEETAEEYKRLIQEATEPSSQQLDESSSSSSHSSHSTGTATVVNSTSTSTNSGNQTAESGGGYGTSAEQVPGLQSSSQAGDYVEGYEMTTESTQKESDTSSFSGADILGALFVMICLGGIYLGFHKKKN